MFLRFRLWRNHREVGYTLYSNLHHNLLLTSQSNFVYTIPPRCSRLINTYDDGLVVQSHDKYSYEIVTGFPAVEVGLGGAGLGEGIIRTSRRPQTKHQFLVVVTVSKSTTYIDKVVSVREHPRVIIK